MSGYTDITLLQYELAKLHTRVVELEERRCEVCGYAEHHREHTGCLRNQVSSLKAELREICTALDDAACDLTLTAVECIKKLKAENEWLKEAGSIYKNNNIVRQENHSLQQELAALKAEQRVAEACALTYLEDYDLTDIAERVRAGEWRKFVKEV